MQGTEHVGVETGYYFAFNQDGKQRESAGIEGRDQGGGIVTAISRAVDIYVFLALQRKPDRAIGSIHAELEAVQHVVRRFSARQASNTGQVLVHEAEYHAVEPGGAHRVEER